ncbi:hypothetical protein GCM10007049_29150 [Echinicola pacifica]|uniref:Outer membrane protein beta-barrel domain-containing protein n=1 Tax=Echinicola pacifica TaxID=346377 RepID=A0A918UTJ1_9BACT|nr:hypothetical protein [Echinicola pacifica]GGZ34001.1 hypothetical protein GCM10007049_29150 [Echinicola pacifica]
MKKLLLLMLIGLPMMAAAQDQAVGLRIGEPLSITYRTWLEDKVSIEAMFGRGSANSSAYYRNVFNNNKPSPNALYVNENSSGGVSINARVAYHQDITAEFDITEGKLMAYGGAGLQLRSIRVEYAYEESPTMQTLRYESKSNIDLGPEVFGGGEYYFEDWPVSVYGELGLLLELVDRPGHVKMQGGIGVRYLF